MEIFYLDLHDFEYLDGENALTVSHLLHDEDNPSLLRNEEVKYYTLSPQIFSKIIFHNLLPKSGEYSHARDCASLIIYCLLRGIQVNILRLIITVMLSDHLLIPSRNLPYEMILTHLFKHLKNNVSDERFVAPSMISIALSCRGCMLVFVLRLLPILLQLLSHLQPIILPLFSSSALDPYADIQTQLSDLLCTSLHPLRRSL